MSSVEAVYKRIAQACSKVGRNPSEVRLLAAIKKQSTEQVNKFIEYCNNLGFKALLGENYVQEWSQKKPHLRGDYECHLIGHLQSNKAKDAVNLFHCIETVDSEKVLKKLNEEAQKRATIGSIFIQVNISQDHAKYGLSVAETQSVFEAAKAYPFIRCEGLMTIPKLFDDPTAARLDYRALKALGSSLALDAPLQLSMGMSNDFEIAIEEGATIVRVGSLLFGSR